MNNKEVLNLIRGLIFEISKLDSFILKSIFQEIEIQKYNWSITNDQAWKVDGENLFESRDYSGKEIKEIILEPTKLVMLLTMKAFIGKTCVIENYDDYINSNCVMVIFFVDATWIEVYCKDMNLLETIKKNITNSNFKNIEYITDENDGRTVFYL